MRLLYVIDSLAPGGAETSLADMANGLVSCGVDLHVLPLGRRRDLAHRLRGAGAEVHAPGHPKGRLGNVMAVQQIIRSVRPDLVHTTLYEADVAGRAAAWTLRIPSSTSIVNDSYGASHYAESRPLALHGARLVDAVTSLTARRFHAITNSIAESVGSRLRIPQAKIDVIPRGRDPQAFPFRPAGVREQTRASLGIGSDAPVILNVGRLEPQKGQELLLHAARIIAEQRRDLVVLIVGKAGRSSAVISDLSTACPFDVRLLGHREDIAGLLSAADVFCFPSEREGFGGVLIEALATGCPVVATDIPTSREVLTLPDVSVARLTSHHPNELASALIDVLDDRQSAERMAASGRKLFESRYSSDKVVRLMVDFFDRAAGEWPS